MTYNGIVHIGIDVHQERLVWFAIDEDGHEIGHGSALMTRSLVAKLAGRWLRRFGQVRTYYEAGPCGYWLHRVLEAAGVKNTVVAPALTPRAPGEKVKTDRRDAAKLARMGMRGMLTAVYVPDRDHEALRNLLRLRKAARDEVRRGQNGDACNCSGFSCSRGHEAIRSAAVAPARARAAPYGWKLAPGYSRRLQWLYNKCPRSDCVTRWPDCGPPLRPKPRQPPLSRTPLVSLPTLLGRAL